MEIDVLNNKGEKAGRTVTLPEEMFGIEPNDHCIYLAIKQYRAAQRQGNHKTKSRGEVRGSTRKLHRQKGTGGSRKGSARNPLYKGGGVVNGPSPHKYNIKLNKKVKKLALNSALSYKAKEENIVVIEDLKLDRPSSKTVAHALSDLSLIGTKLLFVNTPSNDNLYLSTRNIARVNQASTGNLNTYQVVNAQKLVFTESSLKTFCGTKEAVIDEA